MASADKGNGTGFSYFRGFETFEARRLMAVNPVGAPGELVTTGVTAVESAAATPDTTNQFRYAPVIGTNTLTLVPVTGTNGSTPGTALNITIPANSTVSNTDVAANFPGDRAVVTYQVTTTTTTAGGNATTDSDVYAVLVVNGAIVGAPILVTPSSAGNQTDSRVAMDASGNFTVVWQSDISGAALSGRRFNSDGSADGQVFTINSTGVEPDVAESAGGVTVITYSTTSGTYAQLYSAGGAASGAAILVSNQQFTEPAVGVANNGRFVVAYATGSGTGRRVYVQRYDADGGTLGALIAASSASNTAETAPQVAVDTNGGFAVGWAQASSGTTYNQIGFRLFSVGGIARAADKVISGVSFLADHRFGVAYRIPGTVHIAYTDGTKGLMQTYVDDTAGNGIGDEVPPPSGSLRIDLTGSRGSVLQIYQDNNGSRLRVVNDGVTTFYTASSYTSIYVLGSAQGDYIRLNKSVDLPAIVYGRGGRDTITGGSGDDLLDGGGSGTRRDPLTGVTYTIGNVINGGDGNDTLYSGDGPSTLFGGSGDDDMTAGNDGAAMFGEDGNDTMTGGGSDDAMIGGAGNDSMSGGDGADYMEGSAGDDYLSGDDGNDRLYGLNGNDYLIGGLGNDYLNGGRGSDRILGNAGRDTLLGGANGDYLNGGGVSNNGFGGGFGSTTQLDIYYYDLLDTLTGSATRLEVP